MESTRRLNASPVNPVGVQLIDASKMAVARIDWLWPGWLAAGKLHLMAGSPGTGKTTLALALAATVSRGGQWPDGTHAEQGEVLIWSGEDDPEDTLLPRLMANGADRDRVQFVGGLVGEGGPRRAFNPATDMESLEFSTCLSSPRLLIVDPVVSAVSGDSHKNTEVRRSLQPLVDYAKNRKCAVLGITHFGKGTKRKDPTERVVGSLAFTAVARIVLATAKPAAEGMRRLVRAKSNIGPDGGGFEYEIAARELEGGTAMVGQEIRWGETLEGDARQLLGEIEEPDQVRSLGALAEARDFLVRTLEAGPVASTEVKERAEEAGLSWATIRRAKALLPIGKQKEGMGGGWSWQIIQGGKSENEGGCDE